MTPTPPIERETPELKPCPFCGGVTKAKSQSDELQGYRCWTVSCAQCKATFSFGVHHEDDAPYPKSIAGKLWNTRAYETQLTTAFHLAERLKLEAQKWSLEARTQTSTVHEIYQVLSGAKGEPGTWNGARPAREIISEMQSQLTAANERVEVLEKALGFYANPNNYLAPMMSPMTPYVNGKPDSTKPKYDGGLIARAALSQQEGK